MENGITKDESNAIGKFIDECSKLNILHVSNLVCGWINDGYRPPCYMNKEMKCEDCVHSKQTCC